MQLIRFFYRDEICIVLEKKNILRFLSKIFAEVCINVYNTYMRTLFCDENGNQLIRLIYSGNIGWLKTMCAMCWAPFSPHFGLLICTAFPSDKSTNVFLAIDEVTSFENDRKKKYHEILTVVLMVFFAIFTDDLDIYQCVGPLWYLFYTDFRFYFLLISLF